MRVFWASVLLLGVGFAQAVSPQQRFELLESKVQVSLNQIKDLGVQVDLDLRALEARVNHIPPLLQRMRWQLQQVQGHYQRVRFGAPQPLTCLKLDDIAYAINADLSYRVVRDLNFSLNQDLTLVQDAVTVAHKHLESDLFEAFELLSQLKDSIDDLRHASLAYTAGSERYVRLLVQVFEASEKTHRQIRDTQRRSHDLLARSQISSRNAAGIYRQGNQLLSEAKGWLEGLDCQS